MPAYFDTGFSVRQPMWHGEGLVLDDYPVDWTDARKKAGLEWEPAIRPLYQLNQQVAACVLCGQHLGHFHEPECASLAAGEGQLIVGLDDLDDAALRSAVVELVDRKLVVRDDTEQALGVVSDQFSLVSHLSMGGILESVLGLENVKFETAGSCKGGAQVWALAYLDEPLEIAGDDTATYPFIALLNSHDGSGACKLVSTSVRVVCWNTYNAASMQGERSGRQFVFRHVGDVQDRIDEAVKALAGVRDDAAEWNTLANELAGYEVNDLILNSFTADFLPEPVGEIVSERVRANVDVARRTFKRLYLEGVTTEGHRGTGLGLVDTAVEYLDHVRAYRNSDTLMGRTLLRPEPLKAKAVSLVRELCRN